MDVLILDGVQKGDVTAQTVNTILQSELETQGWTLHNVYLSNVDIHHCIGCFSCWLKTPGICLYDDFGREITRLFVKSDLLVLISPITFGGYSSTLKKAVDRLIPVILPFFTRIQDEFHHQPRYEHYPRLLGLGILPHPDKAQEELFKTLIYRNSLNFHSPAHTAGIIYANQEVSETRRTIRTCLNKVEMGS